MQDKPAQRRNGRIRIEVPLSDWLDKRGVLQIAAGSALA
jgi:hypothetical protein